MFWCYQGTSSKDIPGFDAFVATFSIPGEVDGAFQQTKHAIAGLTGFENSSARGHKDDLS
jgi:hypothetical protein